MFYNTVLRKEAVFCHGAMTTACTTHSIHLLIKYKRSMRTEALGFYFCTSWYRI